MIVDANVATYWCVETPFSPSARLVADRTDLKAPSFLRVESTVALLRFFRARAIDHDQFRDGIDLVKNAVSEFVEDAGLLGAAVRIAVSQSFNVHDSLYLALAQEREEPLVTADRRLAEVASRIGVECKLIEPA
jgi:predicted nucleic acid-binding protein